MFQRYRVVFLAAAMSCCAGLSAFNGHTVREGALRIAIDDPGQVTRHEAPVAVGVAIENISPTALRVDVRVCDLVDEWRVEGEARQVVEIPAGKSRRATFHVVPGKGALSALYPVHVRARWQEDGRAMKAHAVRIISAGFSDVKPGARGSTELPAVRVPAGGGLRLAELHACRVAWKYIEGPLHRLPVGWQGSASPCRASFNRGSVTRGDARLSIHMHPPWRPGPGTIFAEYRLALADTEPLTLRFAMAIRDHTASEPPSDGVTFRVWGGEHGDVKLFEKHSASKTWEDAAVDLTRFRGQTILLRLESHPGARNDTTCDQSFWGDPVLTAGKRPAASSDEAVRRRRERARAAVAAGKAPEGGGWVFPLAGGCAAALVPGPAGLLDGAIAFGKGDRCVVLDGMRVAVLGQELARWPSAVVVGKPAARGGAGGGRLELRSQCEAQDASFDLVTTVWAEGPALRVRVASSRRITDVAPGAADRKAPRVYYGHGYCIQDPEPFRAGAGGHNLSTSHVGFDFEGGVSLLVASDNPPRFLEVAPPGGVYALHASMNNTFTFVPGVEGAFDCAVRYRPFCRKKAAPAVARKAGRFVFDIWGGRYGEIARAMEELAGRYGLTDSLLTVHVWQRWGYDYRLPDIYPPNPSLGTVEDLRRVGKVCRKYDIPWGLHDNYIDFYPDAKDYSYDHVCFTESGEPIRAWLNKGREAQSYRWRPDHIFPFVKRNLELIAPNLRPTAYFIDVFTSIPCIDFYDREGNFHSLLETQKCWGEAFAWIRDRLGGDAPTTSEAGDDHLTGYLDGADCQHLRLTPDGGRFCIRLGCKDWERVPWFDAVLHDRFILHGVGYSSRYQGGRPRREAGIESDDYITAEILEGHALMIDRGAFGRGAVRKYWLAQDVARGLAMDAVRDVRFSGGDIHRQVIRWKSGAEIHVNRGATDWDVGGRTLPRFGYLARMGDTESSIERLDGVIVERSSKPGALYVNGRGRAPDARLAIRPSVEKVEYLGGRRFRMPVVWDAGFPAPDDLVPFVHFGPAKPGDEEKILFQGDARTATPTSRWRGRVVTGVERAITLPAEVGPGTYRVSVGLYDPRSGRRFPLLGEDDGSMRYNVGRIVVEGNGSNVTGVKLAPRAARVPKELRWNQERRSIDFGPVVTWGALRATWTKGALRITLLPDCNGFPVTLRLDRFQGLGAGRVARVAAIEEEGKKLRPLVVKADGRNITFETGPGDFGVLVEMEDHP